MLFALTANDRPDALDDRLAHRPEHLKFLESFGDRLLVAGAFLDDAGKANGSIVIIEADSLEEAEAQLGKDPFVREGVFANYQVRPWRLAIHHPPRT